MSTLHPDFPVVTGDLALTKNWSIHLPDEFNRRVEDGSLVLWRAELTFWINVWNNDRSASIKDLLDQIRADANPDRREEQIETTPDLARFTYELSEPDPSGASEHTSINAYVIARSGYMQIGAYFDTPAGRSDAYKIIHSVREVSNGRSSLS